MHDVACDASRVAFQNVGRDVDCDGGVAVNRRCRAGRRTESGVVGAGTRGVERHRRLENSEEDDGQEHQATGPYLGSVGQSV